MLKNITNGQIDLNYDAEDKVSEQYKFIRTTNYDSLQSLKRQDPNIPISYYIQNIRSGSFSQISEAYMKESSQKYNQKTSEDQHFTIDSFQTQMHILSIEFQNKLFKITTFFQGLLAGIVLLYTITLNLSDSLAANIIRVEDQSIRILSLLSTLGALYSVIISKRKYQNGKTRGSSNQIDLLYKSFVLCLIEVIFYFLSYLIYNISHPFAVDYNINGTQYNSLKSLTTIYTVICILGWIITNTNTYKYENKN